MRGFSAALVLAIVVLILPVALALLVLVLPAVLLAFALALIALALLVLVLLVAILVRHDCSSSGASNDTTIVSGPNNPSCLGMFLRSQPLSRKRGRTTIVFSVAGRSSVD